MRESESVRFREKVTRRMLFTLTNRGAPPAAKRPGPRIPRCDYFCGRGVVPVDGPVAFSSSGSPSPAEITNL